ncbi:MAG: DUF5050 domain-containing protein [Clostridia bacterium]|nr:DUF5050 domain-containing protein [Clostridia bacterium]
MNCIGIDFGTSLSSVAVMEEGKPVAVKIDTASGIYGDRYSLPTSVLIEENGNALVGQAADNQKAKYPIRYRKEFKRDLGETIPYTIGGKDYYPEDLCKEILKYLKLRAEQYLGGAVDKAVITYPANYGKLKKDLLKKAAIKAGFPQVELLDEPTAAAIYYSTKEKIEVGEKLLVYDLGGGTFDVALIEKSAEGFRPLTAPLGIERCGGVDFNRKIFEDILETFKDIIDPIIKNREESFADKKNRFIASMEGLSIRLKHQLSSAREAEDGVSLPGSLDYHEYKITREKFENMIRDDIQETCKKIEQIVKNAGLKMQDISKVLMVGGSTRIPYVGEAVEKVVGKKVCRDVDPELAVCYGAAIVARGIIEEVSENNDQAMVREDEAAWKDALKNGSVQAFENYINGDLKVKRYKDQALEEIRKIKDANQEKAVKKDEEAWREALNANTIAAFINYKEGSNLVKNYLDQADIEIKKIQELEKQKNAVKPAPNNAVNRQNTGMPPVNQQHVITPPVNGQRPVVPGPSNQRNVDAYGQEWKEALEKNTAVAYQNFMNSKQAEASGTQMVSYGNSGGNIVNGGVVVSRGGWVYYSSRRDKNKEVIRERLCKVKPDGTFKSHLNNNDSWYINVVGDWAYYRDGLDGGIYKVKTDGTNKIKLSRDVASFINVVGDWIYYVNESDGKRIYKMRTDGSSRIRMNTDPAWYLNVVGEWAYYVNKSDGKRIHKAKVDGSSKGRISNDAAKYLNVAGDFIYYSNLHDKKSIYRINHDGSNRIKLNDDASLYINVFGDYIYYSNKNDGKRLYKLKVDGSGKVKLNNSASLYINVAPGWIYFYSGSLFYKLYKMSPEGQGLTVVD